MEIYKISFSIRLFREDESVDKKVQQELDRRIAKVKGLKQALETKDIEESVLCDIEFHRTIFENSGNYILLQAAGYVDSLMEISIKGNRALILREGDNLLKLYSEHKSIYDAIKRKDPLLARKKMDEHIQGVRLLYQENLP